MHRGSLRADEGSFALEAAVLAPVLIGFLCLVIAFGRTTLAGNGVDAAAKAGAREASIARDESTARTRAMAAVERSLAQDGIDCSAETVVDTSGFSVKVGTAATVTVTVACKVSLSDVAFPGIPGSKTMRGTFTSVIDTYRERSPK
ncbi:TadE/TadG family type IV pilus assembly protein [Embleya sp. NPDC050493]|uniref:TadE/TadG family type IV pilus assembly protein n=1 Tax=Embleya sp. NPDC050493 TaxID=3363989 RepID=UPI003797B0C3